MVMMINASSWATSKQGVNIVTQAHSEHVNSACAAKSQEGVWLAMGDEVESESAPAVRHLLSSDSPPSAVPVQKPLEPATRARRSGEIHPWPEAYPWTGQDHGVHSHPHLAA